MKKLLLEKIKSRFLASFALFLIIVLFLGVPFVDWGFRQDDFGFVYHTKISSLTELAHFFKPHDIGQMFHPPSLSKSCGMRHSFSVFYRPVQFILWGIENYCLGASPYVFLLFAICLHALLSVFLFNIFVLFFSQIIAFFGALIFAFHPTLQHWLGDFSNQVYLFDLGYLLLILFLLKKFIETRKKIFYASSIGVYSLALFTKETLFFFPVWLFIIAFFYYQKDTARTVYRALLNAFFISLGYSIVNVGYLVTRLILFPLPTTGNAALVGGVNFTLASFVARQKERVGDFISYLCDALYVGIIPSGNQILKGILLLLLLFVLFCPIYKNRAVRFLGFCVLSLVVFTWPSLLLFYQPRYMYLGIIIVAVVIMHAINFYSLLFKGRARSVFLTCVGCLVMINMFFLNRRLKAKEQMLHVIIDAFRVFSQDPRIQGKPLCFIGLPRRWFGSGNAQAMWLFSKHKQTVSYLTGSFIDRNQHVFEIKPFDIVAEAIKGGYRITSLHPEQANFSKDIPFKVYNRNKYGLPTDIFIKKDTLVPANKELLVVSWDYQKQMFKLLN